MRISWHHLRYKLKNRFSISRMSREYADALLVGLSRDGITGWGEATDNPYYKSDIRTLQSQLEEITEWQNSEAEPEHPRIFYDNQLQGLPIHPFLKSALDRAYWDFYGRWTGKNIREYMDWDWKEEEIPVSSYTIGLDKLEKMAQKLKAMPWPIYKIKVNGDDPLSLLQYLRQHTDAPFMIDANGSLDIRQLDELISHSSALKLQLIEQPLEQGKDHLLNSFMEQEEVLLAVDESIQEADDLEKLRPYYHVANFKLMKNGGFSPCLDLLARAESLGYKKMMGCMTASSVSIAAICPFLPILDFVDMDGALLLVEDIASGIEFDHGRCVKTSGAGFGFSIDQELIQKTKA